MARYGQAFKDRAVARLLAPESSALEVVAREVGVGMGTLQRWQTDKSAWCREHGLYPGELDQWRASCTNALAEPEEARASRQATRASTLRIRELERDLQCKNNALAETAALLVLSKKSSGDLPQGRGRMIGLEDRWTLAWDIEIAHQAGARLRLACETAGIDARTLQRWKARCARTLEREMTGDGRPQAVHPRPSHALSQAERVGLLRMANEPRFANVPLARIVPMLADEGIYLASESSFSRGRALAPRPVRPPTTHIATAVRQVWCWDMTYLPAIVSGRWFHLYFILNLYSRKIVGWEVHANDHPDHADHLVRRTALAEGIAAMKTKPVLHGDNGATLKATTVLSMLNWLGVKPSYSRPRVSDDNAYAESLFRTAKYRPEFRPEALPGSMKPGLGLADSFIGTTSSIAIAPSVTSVRPSVMPAKTQRFWLRVMRCIRRPVH